MHLDLKFDDGKLVSINHLRTDGQTDKKWREKPIYLWIIAFMVDKNTLNFHKFDEITTKISLLSKKWIKDLNMGLDLRLIDGNLVFINHLYR